MINLGDRMKGYENVNRFYLTKRTPCVIRIDGRHFHSFTKGFKKPYDEVFNNAMIETAKYLCENVMGCKFAYLQSDEISLLLTDYDRLETQSWFDKNIIKMVSISASMATMAFNKAFKEEVSKVVDVHCVYDCSKMRELCNRYRNAVFSGAMFDSRVFNIPKEEVTNYFVWRQRDMQRNSISALAQAHFSQKKLQGKKSNEMIEMLKNDFDINYYDLPIRQRMGIGINKQEAWDTDKQLTTTQWKEDLQLCEFTENRQYIEQHIYFENEEHSR